MPGKLAASPGEKAEMIRARRTALPKMGCCALLGIARSLVYRRRKVKGRHPLSDEVERVCCENPAYGYRRVHAQLEREGCVLSEKQTRLVMQRLGLLKKRKRRQVKTTFSKQLVEGNVAKYLHVRNPNELWVSDITYIPVGKRGFAYLSIVMDACSRLVVGHCLSPTLHTDICLSALEMALFKRKPPAGWVHHSDRGVQYTSSVYRQLVESHGGVLSFCDRGRPLDNAMAESFFKTLKTEEVYMNEYETFEMAKKDISHFIDEVYNRRRLHSSIGYETPLGFEALKAEERQTVSV